MARRKEVPAEQVAELPPPWVRSFLPGLIKFDGDYLALQRARAQWCLDNNSCGRLPATPCVPSWREDCAKRAAAPPPSLPTGRLRAVPPDEARRKQ